MENNSDNIQKPYKGIYTDNSPQEQPKDTYRFALNALDSNNIGTNRLSVEESNKIADTIGTNMIPIGKIYMSDNRHTIFLVSEDESISEFGILDSNNNYTTKVNDELSTEEDKLKFRIRHQINGYYRLRRGCEDTIYFTDYNTKPKFFNYSSPKDFQNTDETWNINLFNLQKTYSKIPQFENITVLESGGNLEPGSYNVAVQLVDESLNPTDWIITSDIIKIYNDLTTRNYPEISGSINSETDYLNFPKTSKAIEVNLGSSLDTDFLYYRLAFIEASTGSGDVNSIKVSNVIPTSEPKFIYTGNNVTKEITEEEVMQFNNFIERVKVITALENRLILGGTEGKQVNFCRLQKYFSKIKADCIFKEISLNDINDPNNPKNPTHEFDGIGYMPGEIYSFAGHFIFDDGDVSPGYHIPGKNPNLESGTMFTTGDNVLPMSVDNQIETQYIDEDFDCSSSSYWGLDSEGEPLLGKNVRHHRFPLRKEVNLPLIESETGEEQTTTYYKLTLNISGKLKTPIPCDEAQPDCGDDAVYDFVVRVTYTVDGEEFTFSESIDPNFYASQENHYDLDLTENSQFHGSNNIEVTKIEVTDINGDYEGVAFTGSGNEVSASYDNILYFDTPATFTTSLEESTGTIQGKKYTAKILGIKFSGIQKPPPSETNGRKIIGYIITRQERDGSNKTIIDSAVMTPSVENEKYISHGLLCPETDKLNKKVFGLISPEHKFKDTEHQTYDKIIQEGNYIVSDRKYGKVTYNDIYGGSSYNAENHKDGNDDGSPADGQPSTGGFDGWSFDLISRDNIVDYKKANEFELSASDIEDRFYLNPLENRQINDYANDVFNICTDNKVGIINTKEEIITPKSNSLPYVILKKENLQAYSNFRTAPFIRQGKNVYMFDETNNTEEVSIYSGDTYISPMRYHNTLFYDNRVAKRKGKGGSLSIFVGAALAVLGAVLLATGVLAPLGAIAIGGAVTIVGGGILLLNSGLKTENYNKAYGEEYDKGLRKTALDNWVDAFYNYRRLDHPNGSYLFGVSTMESQGDDGPTDDSIQWITDCVTDLWFETSINTSLRTKMSEGDTPTYLNSPGIIESGNNDIINTWKYYDIYYTSSISRYPISRLERHVVRQLLAFDQTRNDQRYYIGVALPEFYNINLDYERVNRQKVYFLLPLEYDCCSDCQEKFPHRWHYSEQSFQEELSDNFRVFLPNSYRDIPGETGKIINVFSMGDNLFIHTEEALWMQPKNNQERVTDEVVSFIGTGSYAEIPPRKVLDDKNGSSAGLQHQWGAINTKQGYFFISEAEGKFYVFSGKSLIPFSSVGNYHWFRENIPILNDILYYQVYKEKYPYRDNPSNKFGTGFILGYDTKHERILITKKDYKLDSGYNSGEPVITCGNQLITFPDFQEILSTREQQGWTYLGIENCKLKFERTYTETEQEERIIETNIPNNADVWVMLDMSGSFNDTDREDIIDTVNTWKASFSAQNPDWVGNLYIYQNSNNANSEDWIRCLEVITQQPVYSGVNLGILDIVVISFVNENGDPGYGKTYHAQDLVSSIDGPYSDFIADRQNFINLYNQLNSFSGITYPIVRSGEGVTAGWSRAFLQHSLAALKGTTYSVGETDSIPVNPAFTDAQWETLKTSLQTSNPYDDDGLENYGWVGQWNRTGDGEGNVIDPLDFQKDINAILLGNSTSETILVNVQIENTATEYVDGVIIQPTVSDNSWTRSFSLKNEFRNYYSWTSFHSYLPSIYISGINKLYSWSYVDRNNIYQHNIDNVFREFYKELYPFIVELVSNSNPVMNRTWEFIRLFTEALKYDTEFEDYVEERYITFNKMIAYNSNQCSGELNLKVKDTDGIDEDYLLEQVQNTDDIIIDRNEKDWTINELRDYREDYTKPIWNKTLLSRQDTYYIDKVLNTLSLNLNKNWHELESFRGKYLIVRLIFDKFADTNLICNYSSENEKASVR